MASGSPAAFTVRRTESWTACWPRKRTTVLGLAWLLAGVSASAGRPRLQGRLLSHLSGSLHCPDSSWEADTAIHDWSRDPDNDHFYSSIGKGYCDPDLPIALVDAPAGGLEAHNSYAGMARTSTEAAALCATRNCGFILQIDHRDSKYYSSEVRKIDAPLWVLFKEALQPTLSCDDTSPGFSDSWVSSPTCFKKVPHGPPPLSPPPSPPECQPDDDHANQCMSFGFNRAFCDVQGGVHTCRCK